VSTLSGGIFNIVLCKFMVYNQYIGYVCKNTKAHFFTNHNYVGVQLCLKSETLEEKYVNKGTTTRQNFQKGIHEVEEIFYALIDNLTFTSDLEQDSNKLLLKHNGVRIAEHSLRVAQKAKVLAKQYGVDEKQAEVAGLLHDIGGVYPNDKRVEISNILKLNVLPEEEALPLILHQKISAVMAQQIFNIQSPEILSAIGCHTTLKAGASTLDKILFVADKIEWDQDGLPPYIEEIERAVNVSLELAVYTYLQYLYDNSKLKVVHPWLAEAYKELKVRVK
jgi:predicted HD superfamily hydrolase involved in NAD metabolism